jgi:hypothetical protein
MSIGVQVLVCGVAAVLQLQLPRVLPARLANVIACARVGATLVAADDVRACALVFRKCVYIAGGVCCVLPLQRMLAQHPRTVSTASMHSHQRCICLCSAVNVCTWSPTMLASCACAVFLVLFTYTRPLARTRVRACARHMAAVHAAASRLAARQQRHARHWCAWTHTCSTQGRAFPRVDDAHTQHAITSPPPGMNARACVCVCVCVCVWRDSAGSSSDDSTLCWGAPGTPAQRLLAPRLASRTTHARTRTPPRAHVCVGGAARNTQRQ